MRHLFSVSSYVPAPHGSFYLCQDSFSPASKGSRSTNPPDLPSPTSKSQPPHPKLLREAS
eukprot:scaffold10035_cov176-Skeletonema_marinoi.AAC.1